MNVKLFFERNWLLSGKLKINDLFIGAYRDKNVERTEKEIKSLQRMHGLNGAKIRNGVTVQSQTFQLGKFFHWRNIS